MSLQVKTPYECSEHGNYAPARFCCACTREKVERERDRYLDALDALWTIVLNDVPCGAENPCKVCAPVYAKVREALNG